MTITVIEMPLLVHGIACKYCGNAIDTDYVYSVDGHTFRCHHCAKVLMDTIKELRSMELHKCANNGCENEGYLSFRGRPDLKFCQSCYELIARKIRRSNAEMKRLRDERRRNEADDNKPARQPRGI